MKSLKATKEIEYSSPLISININFDPSSNCGIEFSFACTSCGGYGSPCQQCAGGRVFQYYSDLKDLQKDLGTENVAKIVNILGKLLTV